MVETEISTRKVKTEEFQFFTNTKKSTENPSYVLARELAGKGLGIAIREEAFDDKGNKLSEYVVMETTPSGRAIFDYYVNKPEMKALGLINESVEVQTVLDKINAVGSVWNSETKKGLEIMAWRRALRDYERWYKESEESKDGKMIRYYAQKRGEAEKKIASLRIELGTGESISLESLVKEVVEREFTKVNT